MHLSKRDDGRTAEAGAPSNRQTFRRSTLPVLVCIAATLILAGAAQQAPPGSPDRSIILPEANRPPDANDQMRMREQQAKKVNVDAANLERRKQIADDSAKLLKLATDLKAEVDKTTKDTLSLTVIRKADEIERLARGVKEKMKLTIGAN